MLSNTQEYLAQEPFVPSEGSHLASMSLSRPHCCRGRCVSGHAGARRDAAGGFTAALSRVARSRRLREDGGSSAPFAVSPGRAKVQRGGRMS